MSEKKGWGSTVLGWFVVQDEGSGEPVSGPLPPGGVRFADDIDESKPPAPAPEAPAFVKAPPSAPGGKVDFPGVFEAAGVDEEEQGRVKKAADLLNSLPAGTEPAVKKQIVEASLTAFGVAIEKIIEAGVQEIQALEGYIRTGAADTQKVAEEAQKRIADQEEEIRRLRKVVEERISEQQGVMRACNDKKLEIQKVLEFFGQEAVARVVKDSPKLVEPAPPERK
jgi:hypothetical protein